MVVGKNNSRELRRASPRLLFLLLRRPFFVRLEAVRFGAAGTFDRPVARFPARLSASRFVATTSAMKIIHQSEIGFLAQPAAARQDQNFTTVS
jgi:hypothetical protein